MPGTAVFVLAAVMLTAGMAVLMAVMVTVYIGIEVQIACQVRFDGIVRHSGYASVQLNSGFCQSRLRSAADSAAD